MLDGLHFVKVIRKFISKVDYRYNANVVEMGDFIDNRHLTIMEPAQGGRTTGEPSPDVFRDAQSSFR